MTRCPTCGAPVEVSESSDPFRVETYHYDGLTIPLVRELDDAHKEIEALTAKIASYEFAAEYWNLREQEGTDE